MKIAIASTDQNEEGEISQRGGRSPYYLIYNSEGEFQESIKNPVEQGGGGVGPFVAKMLNEKGVTVFVAEKIGPNMQQSLEGFEIEYFEKGGEIKKALDEVIEELKKSN